MASRQVEVIQNAWLIYVSMHPETPNYRGCLKFRNMFAFLESVALLTADSVASEIEIPFY